MNENSSDNYQEHIEELRGSFWVLRLIKGAVIGIGAVLPGISGGMLSVVFRVYRPLMEFLARPVKHFKILMPPLLPILLGWVLGTVVFARLTGLFFEQAEQQALWLFCGLVAGSMPALWKEGGEHGRGKGAYAAMLIFAIGMLVLLGVLSGDNEVRIQANFFWYILCGALWGLGMVVPGLSPSSILVFLGLYQQMTEGIGGFDMLVILPVLLGILAIVPFARFVKALFSRHYAAAYHAVIGIVAASTLAIVPEWRGGIYPLVNAGCLAAGILFGSLIDYAGRASARKQELAEGQLGAEVSGDQKPEQSSARREITPEQKTWVRVMAVLLILFAATSVVKKYWPIWSQNILPDFLLSEEHAIPAYAETQIPTARTQAAARTPVLLPSPTAASSAMPAMPQTVQAPEEATPTPMTPVLDDWNYISEDIEIHIEKVTGNQERYFVADVKLSSAELLQTAFAGDEFGENNETTSEMAERKQAVFAVNGDYSGFHEQGLIIRNGEAYRANNTRRDIAFLMRDGTLDTVTGEDINPSELQNDADIWQSWCFGPYLLDNSEVRPDYSFSGISRSNPRSGIGMVAPNHFVFIVADGRAEGIHGKTLSAFAKLFSDRGCKTAYNLDGGGSATMYFNGRVVNDPVGKGEERSISDCIYIPYL